MARAATAKKCVDGLAGVNVDEDIEGRELSITLSRLPGGTHIWYRRVEGLAGQPGDVAGRG